MNSKVDVLEILDSWREESRRVAIIELSAARDAVAELIEAAGGGYDVRGETGMELVFDAEDRLRLRAALARVTGA